MTTNCGTRETVNAVIQGWINYYGRFRRSELVRVFYDLNDYLARWAMRKYKRLHRSWRRARRLLGQIARRDPGLFAHWQLGLRPKAG